MGMSAARDITLTLDEETLEKASALAAEDGIPLAALLRRVIERLVESRCAYAETKETAVRRLRQGTSFGLGERVSREELHEREGLR